MSETIVASLEDKQIARQAFSDFTSALEDLSPIERLYRLARMEDFADYLTDEQADRFYGLCNNAKLGTYGSITKEILEHNGLRRREYPCALPDIARLSASPDEWKTVLSPAGWKIDQGILDHLTGAENQKGRTAALISHTHKTDIDIDGLRQTLDLHGIALTTPGNGVWGSWYSPGATLALVFHHPSIEFRFPSWIEDAGDPGLPGP